MYAEQTSKSPSISFTKAASILVCKLSRPGRRGGGGGGGLISDICHAHCLSKAFPKVSQSHLGPHYHHRRYVAYQILLATISARIPDLNVLFSTLRLSKVAPCVRQAGLTLIAPRRQSSYKQDPPPRRPYQGGRSSGGAPPRSAVQSRPRRPSHDPGHAAGPTDRQDSPPGLTASVPDRKKVEPLKRLGSAKAAESSNADEEMLKKLQALQVILAGCYGNILFSRRLTGICITQNQSFQ